jgi:mRNA interferase MazF
MISKYVRGMVYYANIPSVLYAPNVQTGRRPVIIVSNDVANVFSSNVSVVPCTTNINKKDSQPTHVTTNLIKETETIILCENIMTMDKSYLETFVGMLDDITMDKITNAIGVALGFTNLRMRDRVNTLKAEHKEKPQKVEKDKSQTRINFMKTFIEEMQTKGAVYVQKKYGLSSTGAAYQRSTRYKKLLDTK